MTVMGIIKKSNRLNKSYSGKDLSQIRYRALFIGLIFSLVICAITPYNNAYHHATPLGGGHFPLAPFFVLIWLIFLSAALEMLFKRMWLTGKEMLLIWLLMVIASGIAYTGLVRTFFINLTVPYHFATLENRWDEVLQPLVPRPWYPQDQQAIECLYNGLPGGREMGWIEIFSNIPCNVWICPLLIWGGFILLCYVVMICIVNLLSKQWNHNERLNMPLLQLPQMMETAMDHGELSRFILNSFLLTGLLIPVCLHLLNGLHFYYPSVPQIPTLILAAPYFPKHGLFCGFHKLKIYFYPAFIGFAFLTSVRISFSFWFFFILAGLFIGLFSVLGYSIPAAALGITFGPTLSHPQETQMIGAYIVFFFFILWLARVHLFNVVCQVFGRRTKAFSQNEWFSAPLSFWGLILGVTGILWWCCYFGMPLHTAFWVIPFFFMFMVVASRIICQGGIAYFTLTAAPIDGLLGFFGSKFFTDMGLFLAGVIQKVLFVDLRESLMPSLMHSAKLTHQIKNKRIILFSIGITLILSLFVSFLAMLILCYKFGIRGLHLDWAIRTSVHVNENIFNLIESPVDSNPWLIFFTMVGALIMLILVVCSYRFSWWILHPLGYLTAYSSAMRILWFSFFLGWLCNALCMRYGGVLLYKKFRYFFMGFIIGDFFMGGIWAIIGFFTDISYQVLPV